MSSEPSKDHELSQESFDKNGFDPEGYDSEGYDYTGFDRYGYDWHGFNRDGKQIDPLYFEDPEDPEEERRLRAEFFEAGLLYGPDGYNIEGYDGSGQHRSGELTKERFDD